jgi:hypothetical protein
MSGEGDGGMAASDSVASDGHSPALLSPALLPKGRLSTGRCALRVAGALVAVALPAPWSLLLVLAVVFVDVRFVVEAIVRTIGRSLPRRAAESIARVRHPR